MRKTLITLLFLGLTITISGQTQKRTLEVLAGYSENGHFLMANLHFYPNENTNRFFEIGGFAGFLEERNTGYDIPIEVYTFNVGYFTEIAYMSSNDRSFLFSIGIGGVIGNETIDLSSIQLSERQFIETRDGVIYGGYGALRADIALTKHLSLIGRYTHYYHANSDIGKTKFMLGLGLAIKF